MAVSSIGVQQILPRTGTGWQGSHPAPNENSDNDSDDAPARAKPRSRPEPGTGEVVDRVV